jgi:hypothetical protein
MPLAALTLAAVVLASAAVEAQHRSRRSPAPPRRDRMIGETRNRHLPMVVGLDRAKANLAGRNLAGRSLKFADLRRANLSGANLSRADLSGAQLSGANLAKANLSGANLSGATLSGAVLLGANLRGVNLRHALYDDRTLWPPGFNPRAHGATPLLAGHRPPRQVPTGAW